MAWLELTYQLKSVCPLLMHNGQTADPLNKFAKAMKQISSKRKKTDADQEELSHIEFLAGLYMGKDGPIVPTNVIDAMLINAAKKNREGPMAKSGVFCVEQMRLEYEGPRDAESLWKDESFRHVAIVRIGQSRVPRTRPVFHEWSGVVKLSLEDSVVNPARVDDWLYVAGTQVGLCDWRPQHGRFDVKRIG